jgi:3-isopropylmalate/(R)-2-methylmalate dehydratase small subunit
MNPFVTLDGIAIPIEGRNIDTDQVIPARFLKKSRGEYGDYLFYDLRVNAEQQPRTDFILNQQIFQGASVLVCDENFGCGSSREAAVYALVDFGIRAVLAPSFGDIFYNNCLKNGVLPVVLPGDVLNTLRQQLAQAAASASSDPTDRTGLKVAIDLTQRSVHCTHFSEPQTFDIDPFWQECLMKGVDEITLTLSYSAQIQAFEQHHKKNQPWLAAKPSN